MDKTLIDQMIQDCKTEMDKLGSNKNYLNTYEVIKNTCDISKLENNNYYCKYGLIKEKEVAKILFNSLKNNVDVKTLKNLITNSLFALDIDSYDEDAFSEILKPNIIPVKNGVIEITKDFKIRFKDELKITPYRLPVNYNPNASKPIHFLKWIDELLTPEDIKGFQEYMGYCLIPTKKAQKMLLLMGNGGEGKSIVGIILKALLGVACADTEVKSLTDDRFTLSTLEYKLVAYQDDTNKNGIQKSDIFKKIVTNETPMMIEKKNIDKYESFIYSKLVACSNYPLIAIDDDGEGYFRRIYAIRVKPKPKTRINIADYHLPMLNELEGILNWCLEGLIRLIKNNYKFSESTRSLQIINDISNDMDNVKTFIEEMIIIEPKSKIDTKDIYFAYKRYCDQNGFSIKDRVSQKRLTEKLTNISDEYGFKRVRGKYSYTAFEGIKLKQDRKLEDKE